MTSKFASAFAVDSLPGWFPLHHWNEPVYNYSTSMKFFDFSQPSLWIAVGMICFNPVFWNLVARNEYSNHTLQKTFGSPYIGCYVLAAAIFGLGIVRDTLFEQALRHQPHMAILAHPAFQALAWGLIVVGQVFVWTSIYALGLTGTYLGDYFGILMSHRVTGFPFNVLENPMYVGSTLAFLGSAILYRCPAGVTLTGLVWAVYSVALQYEGPFTTKIYSGRHKKSSSATPAVTPSRVSRRLAEKRSNENIAHSYAEAAAEPKGPNGLPSVTPSKVAPVPAVTPRTRRRVAEESAAVASPARNTRGRSRE